MVKGTRVSITRLVLMAPLPVVTYLFIVSVQYPGTFKSARSRPVPPAIATQRC